MGEKIMDNAKLKQRSDSRYNNIPGGEVYLESSSFFSSSRVYDENEAEVKLMVSLLDTTATKIDRVCLSIRPQYKYQVKELLEEEFGKSRPCTEKGQGVIWPNGVFLSSPTDLAFWSSIHFNGGNEEHLRPIIKRLKIIPDKTATGEKTKSISSIELRWDIPVSSCGFDDYETVEHLADMAAYFLIPRNQHARYRHCNGDFKKTPSKVINGKRTHYFCNPAIQRGKQTSRLKIYCKYYADIWFIRFEQTASKDAVKRLLGSDFDLERLPDEVRSISWRKFFYFASVDMKKFEDLVAGILQKYERSADSKSSQSLEWRQKYGYIKSQPMIDALVCTREVSRFIGSARLERNKTLYLTILSGNLENGSQRKAINDSTTNGPKDAYSGRLIRKLWRLPVSDIDYSKLRLIDVMQ